MFFSFFPCFSCTPSAEKLKTELISAIVNKDLDRVIALLALNAPVDFPVNPELRQDNPPANWGSLPLTHFAAMLANGATEASANILFQIVTARASLDEEYAIPEYETSGSILHNVLNEHNYEPSISFLISLGANPLAINTKGHSLVHSLLITKPRLANYQYPNDEVVAQQDKLAILKTLMDNNANIDEADIQLMLKLITKTGKITTKALEILSRCIENQIDISPSPDSTILHLLASHEIAEDAPIQSFVDKAIGLGIPVNKQDEQGRTALYLSLTTGSRLFSYLVPFANVNLADNAGIAPLHLAAQKDVEPVKLLLSNWADVTALDNKKRTVMHYAKDQFVFDLLHSAGAKVDEPDEDGVTPLMCATQAGKLVLISKLLKAGANITATDKNGDNIVFYAQNNTLTLTKITGEIGLSLKQHSKSATLAIT